MRPFLLAIVFATLLPSFGCVVMTVPEPLIPPPRPEGATPAKTFDYTQTVKGDITEDERIESVIQTFGDRLAADEQSRTTQKQTLAENRSQFRTAARRTTLRRRHVHRYYTPRYTNNYSYRSSYAPRHYRSPGIGNTLLFGTIGGVIGHQSGHRDEGILIGAGYGLLRDLLEW